MLVVLMIMAVVGICSAIQQRFGVIMYEGNTYILTNKKFKW